jgi:SAM-dependent methyltransferase
MSCPLCAAQSSLPSWLGTLRFEGRNFPYVECLTCRSLYAHPMPDQAVLSRMYGPSYQSDVSQESGSEDPKDPDSVLAWLSTLQPGTFVDYGCGDGALLARVTPLRWKAIGVEFDPAVAVATERRRGVPVYDRVAAESLPDRAADVLHLGDVIEHLTDPAFELRRILRLVKCGGYLIAQGPLEANPNLFTTVLKVWRRASRQRVSNMAPYHVMLATRLGQEALFARIGLATRQFVMREVEWPAPSRLRRRDLMRARPLGLFALRKASQAVSALRPSAWGNRYFYVGEVAAEA